MLRRLCVAFVSASVAQLTEVELPRHRLRLTQTQAASLPNSDF